VSKENDFESSSSFVWIGLDARVLNCECMGEADMIRPSFFFFSIKIMSRSDEVGARKKSSTWIIIIIIIISKKSPALLSC
jgi:hypothetical protein